MSCNEDDAENRYDTRADQYMVTGRAQRVVNQGTTLMAEYQIDLALSVKSITAHRKSSSYAPIDFDSLNTPLFQAPGIHGDDQTSQEFQPTYSGSTLQGVAGVFYMKARVFNEFDVLYGAPTGPLSLYTLGDIDSETWAAFADVSYNVSDTFNINVGGRYTDDGRRARISIPMRVCRRLGFRRDSVASGWRGGIDAPRPRQ
ncbi:TonB-dependent receptor domain-containing protein [Pseudoduganella namucuonensis]|uniref:Iron complex outermembrane recepter protein n=1 Tax=Pseudoduganella namucuonensis TaxID=1035707 RepID=A0A1I7IBA8_9BURK|nr:TonB-dependent receptor [Pseudoduganella namucuonensis]SFU70252.1 iron complex outermembrane recepter protein [Pseudoduganella namucuonensis]